MLNDDTMHLSEGKTLYIFHFTQRKSTFSLQFYFFIFVDTVYKVYIVLY